MASPFVHLAIADRVWPHLALDAAGLPLFYFGSVAPDVDKLGRCSREASHFWSVSEDVSGALKLLHAHPELVAATLAPAERAFVAGYLCHLVADEQWMLAIYRPFFGRRSLYRGSREGAELQWALHALLEQRLLDEQPLIRQWVNRLAGSRDRPLRADLLPFLAMAELALFREKVVEELALPPGAERARHLRLVREGANGQSAPPEEVSRQERFLAQLPELLPRAAAYVPSATVAEFERRAVDASVTLLGDYLAGRPLRPPPGTAPPTWPAT